MTEYEFVCWDCGGIFTTRDKKNPLCRQCTQKIWKKDLSLTYTEVVEWILNLYGPPSPSPRQKAKWERSREAKRLLEERDHKINKQKKHTL